MLRRQAEAACGTSSRRQVKILIKMMRNLREACKGQNWKVATILEDAAPGAARDPTTIGRQRGQALGPKVQRVPSEKGREFLTPMMTHKVTWVSENWGLKCMQNHSVFHVFTLLCFVIPHARVQQLVWGISSCGLAVYSGALLCCTTARLLGTPHLRCIGLNVENCLCSSAPLI